MMKKNYYLMLILALALGFAACSSSDEEKEGDGDNTLESYIKVGDKKVPIQLGKSGVLIDDRGTKREVGVVMHFIALDATNPNDPKTYQLLFQGSFPYGELVDGTYTIDSETRPIITNHTNYNLGWKDASGNLQMKGYKTATEGSFKVEDTGKKETNGKKIHTISFKLKLKDYDSWVEGQCSGVISSGIYPYN